MEEATRTLFHDALSKSANAATRALADVVVGTPQGHVACWGDLVDYVRAHFQNDEDSLALWQVLADVGDRRPQLLFLDVHRARPAVLRSILSDVRVPAIVQCALVAMPEAEPLLGNLPDAIAPAAREIAVGAPAARARERALTESHMGALRAQRGGAAFSQDAVLRHITEAAIALRVPADVAPVARPVVDVPAVPAVPVEAPHAVRPAPEVAPVVRPVAEAPPAPHVITEVPEAVHAAPEVAPVLRPVGEVAPIPRVITEAPQALRPGGLP